MLVPLQAERKNRKNKGPKFMDRTEPIDLREETELLEFTFNQIWLSTNQIPNNSPGKKRKNQQIGSQL